MTTTMRETTDLDKAGIDTYSRLWAEDVAEALDLDATAVTHALNDAMSHHHYQLVARLLGACVIEHAVWGDRHYDQDDPPVSGFLGRAVDKYIEETRPLAENLQPGLFRWIEENTE